MADQHQQGALMNLWTEKRGWQKKSGRFNINIFVSVLRQSDAFRSKYFAGKKNWNRIISQLFPNVGLFELPYLVSMADTFHISQNSSQETGEKGVFMLTWTERLHHSRIQGADVDIDTTAFSQRKKSLG